MIASAALSRSAHVDHPCFPFGRPVCISLCGSGNLGVRNDVWMDVVMLIRSGVHIARDLLPTKVHRQSGVSTSVMAVHMHSLLTS